MAMPNEVTTKLKEKVRQLPHQPGVYLMKDRLGGVLYVGKAKDLKKRVSTYFQSSRRLSVQQPKVRAMIDLIHDLEVIEVRSEPEALLLEGKLIKEWRPKYNTDFTDDKRFLLVRITLRETLPRFTLTRNRKDDGSRYFGPFAHAGLLRKTLSEMRRRFGILLSDASPVKLDDGRYRLYDDMRAEIYGQVNEVTEADYRAKVEEACVFLEGKARDWLEDLKEKMLQAAENRAYERAAELRDIIQALEKTLTPTRKFERTPALVAEARPSRMEALQAALALPGPPVRMECFDISHISGTFVVASMVHFAGGRPERKHYRRYQIKSFIGNDDFRAMEEVVGRRYQRLRDEGKPMPELIVIDGGQGQVNAALKAFLMLEISPPTLIGLAKKEETILFADGREALQLPLHSPALHLLQHIRDEAHRYANSYNAELRSRRLKESILDDFPGLGVKRKTLLLRHFRSIDRLRQATPDEIAQVEGIGEKTALELAAFLGKA
jgi:excinuclease ABC subunit C